jgi:hypothetical protein
VVVNESYKDSHVSIPRGQQNRGLLPHHRKSTPTSPAAFCPENLGRKVWLNFKAAGEGTMSARRFDLGWLNDIPAVVAPGIALVGHDRGNLSIAELSAKGEHPRIGNTVDDDLDVVFH